MEEPGATSPARLIETFTPPALGRGGGSDAPNLLVHGDNRDALRYLLANGFGGRIKLVYIDPPFDSAADYARKVTLRGGSSKSVASIALGTQTQYTDVWRDDRYLPFMRERLVLLRDILAEDGSLWLHCDYRREHHLRLLLEEVFGEANYLNTIIWRSQVARGAKVNAFYFPYSAHYLHVFARNRSAPTTWNPIRKQVILTEAEAAAEYMRDERGFFRTSDPGSYTFDSLKALHAEGRLYAPYGGQVRVDERSRRVTASNGGNIGVKYYLKTARRGRYLVERAVDNVWDDIPGLGTTPGEDTGYPTQKTESLLRRIISASTCPGDWVLDAFAGSGTTAAAAHKLGRRWIGCDLNYGAIQTAVRRMQAVVQSEVGSRLSTVDFRLSTVDFRLPTSDFAVYRLTDGGMARHEASESPRLVVSVRREDGRIHVTVQDFFSPAILARVAERLPAGDANTAIPNWRVMVDSIAIDPNYDGRVFRVALADAPLKRSELVTCEYTLEAPSGGTCVAVRLTDVMGGEAFVVEA